MAKIKKLYKKTGKDTKELIYPATITQAIKDGETGQNLHDYMNDVKPKFKFNATQTDGQLVEVGSIQLSQDGGKTWNDISPEFINNLRIQKYVATASALPSGQPVGTIYAVGPTYDAADTSQTNPIYTLYVYDGNQWVNNGKFTSIAAGVVQETGDSETQVMSQKATTEKLTELASEVTRYNRTYAVSPSARYPLGIRLKQGVTYLFEFTYDGSLVANIMSGSTVLFGATNREYTPTSDIEDAVLYVGSTSTSTNVDISIITKDNLTTKITALENYKEVLTNNTIDYQEETVTSQLNSVFSIRVSKSIPAGTPFNVNISGNEGILSYDLIGMIYAVDDAGSEHSIASQVSSVSYSKDFTLDYNIKSIRIERGASGVISVGDITLGIKVQKYYTKQETIEQIEKSILPIEQKILDVDTLVQMEAKDFTNTTGSTSASNNRAFIYFEKSNVKSIYIQSGYKYVVYTNNDGIGYPTRTLRGSWTDGGAEYNIESGDKYIYVKVKKSNDGNIASSDLGNILSLHYVGLETQINGIANSKVYVNAVNGSDDNDGTQANPYATFAKAMDSTGKIATIVLIGDTTESFNIASGGKSHVTLIGSHGHNNRIIKGSKIADAISVQSDVYSVSMDSFPSDDKFYLFQHEINDVDTLILESERHPLQRDRLYRCGSTRITRVSSLDEVKLSSVPVYYYDSTDKILYFRAATGSDIEANPIYIPSGSGIYGNDGSITFECVNIDVLYGTMDLTKCHNGKITDCSAKYSYGAGAIFWDGAIGLQLIRCEAARAFSGTSSGDGFNAHAITSTPSNSRHTICTMIDCWSHDNNDDGYSDHERCETTIIGGLFEYNIKGGITPSYGAQDTIYNAYCRHQQLYGILYVGAITELEGGQGGQVHCVNCICENNGTSNYSISASADATYQNTAVMINCISLNAGTYGYSAMTNSKMILHNCSDSGSSIVKNGNIEVVNAEIVK